MIFLLDSGVNQSVVSCVDHFSVTETVDDIVGHGTTMASVIKNIDKDVKIVSIKMGDSSPVLPNALRCLEFIDSITSTDIINVVLFNANFFYDLELSTFESKLNDLSKKYLVVVPAGNNSSLVDFYSPARCNFVWNVGSFNKNKQITSVTNFDGNDRKIDFYVVSTSTPARDKNNNKIKVFGTSVAASVVAALANKHQTTDKLAMKKLVEIYNDSVAFN